MNDGLSTKRIATAAVLVLALSVLLIGVWSSIKYIDEGNHGVSVTNDGNVEVLNQGFNVVNLITESVVEVEKSQTYSDYSYITEEDRTIRVRYKIIYTPTIESIVQNPEVARYNTIPNSSVIESKSCLSSNLSSVIEPSENTSSLTSDTVEEIQTECSTPNTSAKIISIDHKNSNF